jgi:hypothetical protein
MVMTAAVLAGFGISWFVHFVNTGMTAYQPDSSISISKDGVTLYTEGGGTVRPADLTCSASGLDSKVQLRPVSGQITLLSNGEGTFEAIASTPQEFPTGSYVISCVSASGMDVPLFVGPRFDSLAVGRILVIGIITPLFLGICATVLVTILAVKRYRAHWRATSTA